MPRPAANLFPDESSSDTSSSGTSSSGTQNGWVTAHCDGGARGNPGPAGFGALLQDEAGLVLAELSEFLGVRTNNYAEYSGLLACLQWVLDHGQRRLRVISDSELMVKQIQGKYKVNSPDLRPLWEEARRRIAQLERFEIAHALRHKNKAADQLANQAMDRGTKQQRTSGPQQTARANPHPAASSISPSPASAGAVRENPKPATPVKPVDKMLRGFTRDGAIYLLGGATLPDGIFVKITPE